MGAYAQSAGDVFWKYADPRVCIHLPNWVILLVKMTSLANQHAHLKRLDSLLIHKFYKGLIPSGFSKIINFEVLGRTMQLFSQANKAML